MKSFFAKTALAAATVLCVGVAHAGVIDFESVDTTDAPFAPLINNGADVTQGKYLVGFYDGTGSTDPTALVGALIGGSSGGTCDAASIICPGGNSSAYLAVTNTGVAYVQSTGDLTLTSFDAGFIAPGTGVTPGAFGLLAVQADRADGTAAIGAFVLNGPDSSGATSFSTFLASDAINGLFGGTTGSIDSGNFVDYQFYEFYCTSSSLGSCNIDTTNTGQFALDNITFADAVPEPSSWALMAFGLAAVGAVARRRRSV